MTRLQMETTLAVLGDDRRYPNEMSDIVDPALETDERIGVAQESQACDPMVRWISVCRHLLIPIDCVVLAMIAFAIPHGSGVAIAKFWLYFFPVACAVWLIITGSVQSNRTQIPKLVGFAGVSTVASLIHVPLYWAFKFWDNLGQI
ncbi:hypothetical protein [Planctomycetes bacterium K23_9]|uniref:Uncharacterized protein n=1 Tax=Stieleria marina TaxID=1930275 RepID=A0A517NTT2_9BACT|nr:hypothetical protein K239x_24870 [Planctomycetes bacterium K23_9]